MGPLFDYRDESGNPLPLKSLQIEANMMLVGETDTTSITTAYTAWDIARNPAIQEQLFEDLKAFDLTSPLSLKPCRTAALSEWMYKGGPSDAYGSAWSNLSSRPRDWSYSL
jgi:cytochrome P450